MIYNFEKDLPIEDVSQDILGRDKFAKNLSDAIIRYIELQNNQDCLVIGLEGEWGSGKTSLINLMSKYLKDKVDIEFFNSWMNLNKDDLGKEFLYSLFKLLSRKSSDEFIKKCQCYGKRILNGVEIEFSGKIPGIDTGISISKEIKFEDKSLLEQKEELKRSLSSSDGKWSIVFIDDIDRLSSDEIALLFQIIKTIADFPKVIYILAYDKSVVVESLKQIQNNRGEDYLQKVVQVTYDVPQPGSEDLQQYFIHMINQITTGRKEFRYDNDHFWALYNQCFSFYLKTLRDCKRVCNSFAMKYALCGEDVDIGDLAGITILEIFENKVYQKIKSHKAYMLGVDNYGITHLGADKLEPFSKELLDAASEKNRLVVKDMIDLMFPGFWKRTGQMGSNDTINFGSSGGFEDYICSKDSFNHYFALSMRKDEVPLNEVIDFFALDTKDKIVETLNAWNDNNLTYNAFLKANMFIREIGNRSKELELSSGQLKWLLEALSMISLKRKYRIFIDNYFLRDQMVVTLANLILKDRKTGFWNYNSLMDIMSDSHINLYLKTVLLQSAGTGIDWYYGSKNYKEQPQILKEEEFQKLKYLLFQTIIATKEEMLFKEEGIGFLFFIWRKEDENSFRKFLKEYKSPMGLINRISIFLNIAVINGNPGDKEYSLNDHFNDFMDINLCAEELDKLMLCSDFKNLNVDIREKCLALHMIFQKMQQGIKGNYSVRSEDVLDYLKELVSEPKENNQDDRIF